MTKEQHSKYVKEWRLRHRRFERDRFIGPILKQEKYKVHPCGRLDDAEFEAHLEWVARNGGPDSRNLGRQLAGVVSELVIDWRYCHAL